MPKGEQIKDKFVLDYSVELLDLLNRVKERDILKREDTGNLSVDFIDFIIYNIDIQKYVNKNLSK
jgi:hypothetical protein